MAFTSQTFSALEQPTLAKWNILNSNDDDLNARLGVLETNTIASRGINKGSDTAAGGVTSSYATYATVTATSTGGLIIIDVSMIFNNASSGADRGASYKVQCDGVDVGTPLSGVILVPLSPTNLPIHFSESFTHTPSAGSHTWTLQCLASINTAVTLRRPTIEVREVY